MRKPLLTIITVYTVFALIPSNAAAQTMQNEDHFLELQPVEDYQTESIVTKNTPTTTKAPSPPRQVKFRQLKEPGPKSISIAINTDLLSFGVLSPTSPSEREIHTRLVGTTGKQFIYISKEGNLINGSNDTIPDTSCDQGQCSELIASDWINTLTFGYGYTCISQGCDADFARRAYRPFPASLTSIFEANVSKEDPSVLEIPVKINVPGTQQDGFYETSITILTVPSL